MLGKQRLARLTRNIGFLLVGVVIMKNTVHLKVVSVLDSKDEDILYNAGAMITKSAHF